MRLRVTLAALAVSVTATLSPCAWRVESVPVAAPEMAPAAVVEPALFKLRLRDVTLDAAVDAFNDATGLAVTVDPADAPAGPVVVYDVTVDAATPQAALVDFARQLRMGVTTNNGVTRITPRVGPVREAPAAAVKMPAPPTTAAVVTITGVEVRQHSGPGRSSDSMSVGVTVAAGVLGAVGTPVIEVTSAVDDVGRSLVPKKPDEPRPGDVATPGPFDIDAVFDLPLPRPQRIADFRADVVVRVPRTVERLTVTDFTATPVECVLAGVKLRIGPAYLKNGHATVDLAIDKAAVNQNQNRRPAWIDSFDAVRVEVGGRAMGLMRDDNDTKGPWRTFTLRVASLDGSTPHYGPITTLPTTLTWDIPGASESVRVPIVAHNLMVP